MASSGVTIWPLRCLAQVVQKKRRTSSRLGLNMEMETQTSLPAHSAGQRRALGALLVAVSAASFGAMPIFARQAYAAGVDQYGILLPRFVLAAALLAVLAGLRGA